jgi:spore germination protein GerM
VNRRAALLLVAASVVVVAALLVWLLASSPRSGEGGAGIEPPAAPTEAEPAAGAEGEAEATEVEGAEAPAPGLSLELYFPGGGKRLYAERRPVSPPAPPNGEEPTLADRVRTVVEALLAGPESAGRRSPLPEGVTLVSVYMGTGGVAYLDFQAPDGAPPPATGSMAELLTVYSIVNSVLRNVPEVRAVGLLWNGNQRATFSGHVDTRRPLLANPRLLAG